MPVDVCQGENFPQEPKKHENKKHKKMGIDIVGLTQLQKPPENQKNKKQKNKQTVSTHGEGLRRSWTGDMG